MARPVTRRSPRGVMVELLTFERLMTTPLTHLVYWSGLAIIVLIGFGMVGGAVGMLLRGGGVESMLLSLPLAVGGLLVCLVLGVLWRGMCEFYLAVLRIADDLSALRGAIEREEAEADRHSAALAQRPLQGAPSAVARSAAEG